MTNQVLAQFLLHVGDSQLILSHRLAEWCGHAPELSWILHWQISVWTCWVRHVRVESSR